MRLRSGRRWWWGRRRRWGRGGGGGGGPTLSTSSDSQNQPRDTATDTAGNVAAVIAFVAAISAGVLAFSKFLSGEDLRAQGRVVTVVFLLRRGGWYGNRLDQLVAGADFGYLAGRDAALLKLADLISPEDVIAKHVSDEDAALVGGNIEAVWRQQQRRLGIVPRVMNAATSQGAERFNRLNEVSPIPDDSDSVCLLGIVLGRASADAAKIAEAVTSQGRLVVPPTRIITTGNDGAAYLYYTPRDPDTDQPLGLDKARLLFDRARRGT